MAYGGWTGQFTLPPIGADDTKAASVVQQLWGAWQQIRRPWLREVEENVRMLSGRQYDEYIPELGRFEDISQYWMSGDEAWRQEPVFNWIGQVWFPSMLGKLTENVPILGAIPATSDARDQSTAQIFDPVFRYEWDQMGMARRYWDLQGWQLTAGRGILWLRIDPKRGPSELTQAPATLQMPDGSTRTFPAAPYYKAKDGSWQVALSVDPQTGEVRQTNAVGRQWLGDLACDVPNPTSILLPYGPGDKQRPAFVMREYLKHVDEIRDEYDVEVEPDPGSGTADDLLYALSYTSPYATPGIGDPNGLLVRNQAPSNVVVNGMVRVREYWCPATEREGNGRVLIVAQNKTLSDGENPYIGPGALNEPLIPCYLFDRPLYPWRQEGSTDLEGLKPVNRAINRRMAALMDAADYFEQPTRMINEDAISDRNPNFGTRGGEVRFTSGMGEPAFYLQPPPLPQSSLDLVGVLTDWAQKLGHTQPVAATVPNDTRSGELLQQERFDTDRPIGAALRQNNYVWAEFGEGVMHLLGVLMQGQGPRLLNLSGEDNAATYLSVESQMFEGRVNVKPSPENAELETKPAKQQRIAGLMGTVAQLSQVDPGLGKMFAKAVGYPDVIKALRPGGEAYSVQVRELQDMVQTGAPALVLPDDDDAVHLDVITEHQQTLAYRTYPPQVQTAIGLHKLMHEANASRKAVQQAQQQALVQGAVMQQMAPVVQQQADLQGDVAERSAPPEPKGAGPAKLKRVK